jgi:predicted DCC family thiol-disulfide oxidoreductase YuxK
MTTEGKPPRGWLKALQQRYGLDIRSLALLRMGLAIAILTDLWWRAPDIAAHYSDQGVLPRTTLIDGLLDPWYWSVHLLSGQTIVQQGMFLSAALLAIALLVGYRTRLVTIASWALLVSLHHRNPALLFAADSVLRTMMFWAMFLPLGAAYSVDSAMNPRASSVPRQIFSGVTVALMAQQCFIYIFSAVFKTTSPIWWPDLTAVYYALSFDQYATVIGAWLLTLPPILLKTFTAITLVLEWVGPLFLFMPWRTHTFRVATVITFILLHIGFGFTLHIGIFPFLSCITWLAFLPSSVWEGLSQRVYGPPQAGLAIYYDADCGFCKKVVYLLRTFLLLPKTPLETAQSVPAMHAEMEHNNSWVVVDWQGNYHFKFEAIAYVVSLSPVFRCLTPLLRWGPVMAVGTRFYEWIANNRRTAGFFTRPFSFRSFTVRPPLWQSVVALGLIGFIFVLNLQGITNHWAFVDQNTPTLSALKRVTRSRSLQRVEWIGYLLRLDQGGWGIFAPAPPRDDGWPVVVGTLENGKEVNLLEPGEPIDFDKPTLADRRRLYGNMQWRTYFINLNRNIGNQLYADYGDYLCRTWQGQSLEQVDLYFVQERTDDPGQPVTPERTLQAEHLCESST